MLQELSLRAAGIRWEVDEAVLLLLSDDHDPDRLVYREFIQ
jgi:hypothetical protein